MDEKLIICKTELNDGFMLFLTTKAVILRCSVKEVFLKILQNFPVNLPNF